MLSIFFPFVDWHTYVFCINVQSDKLQLWNYWMSKSSLQSQMIYCMMMPTYAMFATKTKLDHWNTKGKPRSFKVWRHRFLLFSNFCAIFKKSWAFQVTANEFVFVYKILAQFFENRRNLCHHCLKLLGLSSVLYFGQNELRNIKHFSFSREIYVFTKCILLDFYL